MWSEESKELYEVLLGRGYDEKFCMLIANELRTTWTASRMLGYLRYLPKLKEEDIVDEMLAILEDRNRIQKKKEMEFFQGKINELYMTGLGSCEDED